MLVVWYFLLMISFIYCKVKEDWLLELVQHVVKTQSNKKSDKIDFRETRCQKTNLYLTRVFEGCFFFNRWIVFHASRVELTESGNDLSHVYTQRMREFAPLRLKIKYRFSNVLQILEAARKYTYYVQSYCKGLDTFNGFLCINCLCHEHINTRNISTNDNSVRFCSVFLLSKLFTELTLQNSNMNS
jgi:hypothetical protein